MISSLALHFRRRIGALEIAASQQRSAARLRAHDGCGFPVEPGILSMFSGNRRSKPQTVKQTRRL
jgi:hypothetical protein